MVKRIIFLLVSCGLFFLKAQAQIPVFVNELHYDDVGTDTLEGFEIAGPAGTNLSCFRIYLYNGATPGAAVVYDSIMLSGVIADQCNGFGTVWFPFSAIQNGASDGFALVFNPSFPGCGLVGPPTVVQFLSYEGVITAANGPAIGLTSTDIGVSENSSTGDLSSLQLTGNGTLYGDFTWTSGGTNTHNALNNGQTFGGPCGSGPVVATQLQFTSAAGGCILPGQTFSLTVCATNAAGSVDIAYANNISLNLISGPGSLGGTLSQMAIAGCATFSGLTASTAGTYQIRASDGTWADTTLVYISSSCANCPNLNAVLVDACGAQEGQNEILFLNSGDFSIPVDGSGSAFNLNYGTTSPPSTGYTNSLVSNQDYIDSLNNRAGCGNLFVDALSNSPIPPNTQFLVMNFDPLTVYDFSAWCSLGPIYVVFSNDPDWNQAGGNFKNCTDCAPTQSGTLPRFFQADFSGLPGGPTCNFNYSYTPCTDLPCLGNGDGIDFGYGGGTPTASWNECNPSNVLDVKFSLPLQAERMTSGVRLNWQTSSEVNSSLFKIFRSSNGASDFQQIGSLPAAGNSNHPRDYQWNDNLAPEGRLFYRLEALDLNGSLSQSAVVTVMGEGEGPYLELLQVQDAFNFNLHGLDDMAQLEIFDLQGRIIFQQSFDQNIRVAKAELPNGLLLYSVKAGGRQFGGKLRMQD